MIIVFLTIIINIFFVVERLKNNQHKTA